MFQPPFPYIGMFLPNTGMRWKSPGQRGSSFSPRHNALDPHSVSHLSLQTKLLLDLVADAQSYHLEEQRYTFNTSNISKAYSQPQPRFQRKKELHSAILSCQSQRMEVQWPVPHLLMRQEFLMLLLELKVENEWRSKDSGPLCMPSGARTHSQPVLSLNKSSVFLFLSLIFLSRVTTTEDLTEMALFTPLFTFPENWNWG